MGGITQELIINGNVLDELNLACDPVAAECVLYNGKNVSVITGNNCLEAFFTQEDFDKRLVANNKPIARYITDKCSYWFNDMMDRFNINGFHNWDVVAAAYLSNPSLFNDNHQLINPNIQDLEKGFLGVNPAHRDDLYPINIPVIADIKEFIDDIFDTWLSVKR